MNRHRTAAVIPVGLQFKALVSLLVLLAIQSNHVLFAQQTTSPIQENSSSFEDTSSNQPAVSAPAPSIVNPTVPSHVENSWSVAPHLRPGDPGNWHERHSSKVKFRLRGRIDADYLGSNQSAGDKATFGNLGEETGFRRARIGAEGNFSESSRYVGEIDLATGQVILKDLYFALGKVEDGGEFKFGHMREPFSLEGGTSANSFAFMERSTINVLDPARNWGVDYTRCGEDEDWTFSGGLFQAGTDPSDFQFGSTSTSALTTRWTALAWYEDHGQNLMHFGISLSERIADQGFISINQQPQSPLLSFSDSTQSPFIPRLVIPARFQELINLQWAYMNGPLWSQAEWYATIIDQTNGPPVFYHGSHADLGYFITGGQQTYLTKTGLFGPVTVHRPVISQFSSKSKGEQLGYGAWEATIRMAYLDFVDSHAPTGPQGQATGVKLPQLTVGLNWYLADRMRIMCNYTYAFPDEVNTGTTTVSVIGLRLAMFW